MYWLVGWDALGESLQVLSPWSHWFVYTDFYFSLPRVLVGCLVCVALGGLVGWVGVWVGFVSWVGSSCGGF